MINVSDMDSVIDQSLRASAGEFSRGEWKGRREREVVSLYCFGHLVACCKSGALLHDPAQIAIEVAVPQIAGQLNLTGKDRKKTQVCKDIVIWPRPRMVCWNDAGEPAALPLSVIEWKHNQGDISSYDLAWLREFSALSDEHVGYIVSTNLPSHGFTLSCTRAFGGQTASRWLHID